MPPSHIAARQRGLLFDERRLMTMFLLFQIRDSPKLDGQDPVFISPGTGWPSYTPRQWVPFSSPLSTHRATVEVFDPAFTRSFVYDQSVDNIVCFEHLSDTSQWIEKRTLSVTHKWYTRRPLLANNGIHVTAIARQPPLHYCVCIGKSKCFWPIFPILKNKNRHMRSPCSVSVYSPLSLLGNGTVNTFTRQRIHMQ
jgi:hypothetical protein